MRLWSIHPKYLDSVGLVALWREGLLAQAVLRGETRGYRHHPQLERFRDAPAPEARIAQYLAAVHEESVQRGYSFAADKVGARRDPTLIEVTRGQLDFEWQHLMAKLRARAPERFEQLRAIREPAPHPLFAVTDGDVAPWERAAAAKP